MPSHDLLEVVREQCVEDVINGTFCPLLEEKDVRAIKSNLQIVRSPEQTFVIVLAIHKDMGRNVLQKLRCEDGTPIGGYVYDNVNNCYYVKCIAFQPLGYVPFACLLRVKDNYFWRTYIPLPETLLLRNWMMWPVTN